LFVVVVTKKKETKLWKIRITKIILDVQHPPIEQNKRASKWMNGTIKKNISE